MKFNLFVLILIINSIGVTRGITTVLDRLQAQVSPNQNQLPQGGVIRRFSELMPAPAPA